MIHTIHADLRYWCCSYSCRKKKINQLHGKITRNYIKWQLFDVMSMVKPTIPMFPLEKLEKKDFFSYVNKAWAKKLKREFMNQKVSIKWYFSTTIRIITIRLASVIAHLINFFYRTHKNWLGTWVNHRTLSDVLSVAVVVVVVGSYVRRNSIIVSMFYTLP